MAKNFTVHSCLNALTRHLGLTDTKSRSIHYVPLLPCGYMSVNVVLHEVEVKLIVDISADIWPYVSFHVHYMDVHVHIMHVMCMYIYMHLHYIHS